MILQVTSLLFATVVIHASFLDVASYQHIFSAVTVLSLVYHSTHDKWVGIADMIMAHFSMSFVLLWETQKLVMTNNEWLLLFPSLVTLLWVAEDQCRSKRSMLLHALLHVTSVVGLHAYLYFLY